MSPGGGGTSVHSSTSRTNLPRSVGELRPGCERSASRLTCVSRPARALPAGNSNGSQPSARAHRHPVDDAERAGHERAPRGEQLAVVAVVVEQVVGDDAQGLLARVLDQRLAEGGEERRILAHQAVLDLVEAVEVGEEGAHGVLQARRRRAGDRPGAPGRRRRPARRARRRRAAPRPAWCSTEVAEPRRHRRIGQALARADRRGSGSAISTRKRNSGDSRSAVSAGLEAGMEIAERGRRRAPASATRGVQFLVGRAAGAAGGCRPCG